MDVSHLNDHEQEDALQARIHALETAIRAITYTDRGAIRNSFQDHVDLGDKQPILRDVWNSFGK